MVCLRRYLDVVASSPPGVALTAATATAVALLLIRPAFVLRRQEADMVLSPQRIGVWAMIVFAVVALRDQLLQVYHNAIVPGHAGLKSVLGQIYRG